MSAQRGRRNPQLLEEPAASPLVAPVPNPELEAARKAQLKAVAEVEASMRSEPAPQPVDEPVDVVVDLEPTPQERYEARLKAMPASETRWKVGARAKNVRVEGFLLQLGDIVPGADGWLRREAWESAGFIERA